MRTVLGCYDDESQLSTSIMLLQLQQQELAVGKLPAPNQEFNPGMTVWELSTTHFEVTSPYAAVQLICESSQNSLLSRSKPAQKHSRGELLIPRRRHHEGGHIPGVGVGVAVFAGAVVVHICRRRHEAQVVWSQHRQEALV